MFWLVIGFFAIYLLIDWLIRLPRIGSYSNKYVFITGCDTGFGRELAIRLDTMGFSVLAACFTQDGRQSLADVCSSRLSTLDLDVTKTTSIQAALVTVKQKLPSDTSLWAVVNNAGILGAHLPGEMCTRELFMSVCQVNLFGPMEVCRQFSPLIRKSNGRFVNMTSTCGRIAAGDAPYCSSKYGLEAYSDVLRRDMHPFGVKVSIIEPGFFNTGIFQVDALVNKAERIYNECPEDVKEAYGKDLLQRGRTQASFYAKHYLSNQIHKVIDAYVDALTCKHPRCRYVVGNDSKFFFIPLSLMPAWVSDTFFRLIEKR